LRNVLIFSPRRFQRAYSYVKSTARTLRTLLRRRNLRSEKIVQRRFGWIIQQEALFTHFVSQFQLSRRFVRLSNGRRTVEHSAHLEHGCPSGHLNNPLNTLPVFGQKPSEPLREFDKGWRRSPSWYMLQHRNATIHGGFIDRPSDSLYEYLVCHFPNASGYICLFSSINCRRLLLGALV